MKNSYLYSNKFSRVTSQIKPVLTTNLLPSEIRCVFRFLCFMLAGLFINIQATYAGKERFAAPKVNSQAAAFNERFSEDIFNVDFIVSLVTNAANAANESEEINEDDVNSTVIDQSNTSAGSVIVPIGTDVDELIIINENDGDNIVVNR